jgi:hypothetical protein
MSDTKENPSEPEVGDIFQGKEDAVGSIPRNPENGAGPGDESENHEAPTRAGIPGKAEEFEIQPPPRETTPRAAATSSLAPVRKGWLSRVFEGKARREHQLQTLQTGYLEMLQMMRSISSNLDRQSEMHCKLIETLEQFPEALKGMESVGRATEQQTKMLGAVQQQLTLNAEQDEKMIGSLNSFNETLGVMDETSRRSSETIGTLVDHSRVSERELRNMLERSDKRMTWTMTIMSFVVLAGALFGGYIIIQNRALRASIAPIEEKSPPAEPGIPDSNPNPDAEPGHAPPEQPKEDENATDSVRQEHNVGREHADYTSVLNPDWRSDPDFESRVRDAVGGPRSGDPEPKGYKSVLERIFRFYHGNDARDPDSGG